MSTTRDTPRHQPTGAIHDAAAHGQSMRHLMRQYIEPASIAELNLWLHPLADDRGNCEKTIAVSLKKNNKLENSSAVCRS
jgi:hypothetical protein